MRIPVQVTFHEVPHSDAVEAHVRTLAERLEEYFPRITSCRVVVEAPHRHRLHGRPYHVRVDLAVPGGELVAGHERPGEESSHRDVYAAIDHAFDIARRRLQDHARRRRGDVKSHEAPLGTARVVRIGRAHGFGFLETEDGREVFFHRHAVLGGAFERLHVGSLVRFVEEQGDKGPQASTVVALAEGTTVPGFAQGATGAEQGTTGVR